MHSLRASGPATEELVNMQEPATLTVITDPLAQRKLTLALSFVIFFSVLNGTMFNVSIPDIAKQFDLLPSEVSWVVSGYIIIFALGSVTYGRLADSHAVKNLITIGLVLFCAGSLVGFMAEWYPMLIIGRMVQASGSGAIPALAMLVATRYFPAEIRGRSLGVIASSVAFGGAVGPMLGGFVTAAFHWRYLFLFTLFTLAAIPFLRRFLPEEEERRSAFDMAGALLMAGAVGGFLLFITIPDWRLLAASAGLALWFYRHIKGAKDPFINIALFMNHRYRTAVIATFFMVGTVFGMMFLTPLMLRDLNGLGAGGIGMVMFPGAMSAALLGFFGGRLSDRKGSVWVVGAGQALLFSGFLLLSSVAGRSPVAVAAALILCYAGFSFLQSSLAHTVSGMLLKAQLGAGMGIYNLMTFMAGAVNAALIGKILDHTRSHGPLNPLNAFAAAGPYSNLFLFLAAIVLFAAGIFRVAVRGRTDS
jgi:DHA2 family metal-tetracycline-proton antiporter-like MFS transporter